MAVVLADGQYRVIRQARPANRDAHGTPVPTVGEPTGLVAGAARRQPDGSWSLRLDPQLWPVQAGDTVERPADEARWVVTGVPRLHEVPGVPDVDHITVTALQEPPDTDRGYPTREV